MVSQEAVYNKGRKYGWRDYNGTLIKSTWTISMARDVFNLWDESKVFGLQEACFLKDIFWKPQEGDSWLYLERSRRFFDLKTMAFLKKEESIMKHRVGLNDSN